MKLPINPFLHLLSLGAVGGMVMVGMQSMKDKDVYLGRRAELAKEIKTLRASSKTNQTGSDGWNYQVGATRAGSPSQFWMQLTDANFIGKVKVEDQPKVADPEAEEKKTPGVIDLNDILHVIAITYGDGLNGAVVNYTASVEVPEEFKSGPSSNVISNSIPEGRRRRSKAPRVPTRQVASSPPHHLKIGDHLWPPYEHVFLHGIATDASEVDFELRVATGKDPEKKNVVQTILKNQLGLPTEILKSLVKGAAKAKAGDAKKDVKKAKDEAADYKWIDQPTTFVDRRGNVNISRKDSRWLSREGGQIFNEDVHMRDYSAGSAKSKVQGVQLRKLSPRVTQFGAREGDVVIAINNEPVKGMAAAKRLGRRLYNKGVRSYRVEIMRRGERQTLYYHLDKDK